MKYNINNIQTEIQAVESSFSPIIWAKKDLQYQYTSSINHEYIEEGSKITLILRQQSDSELLYNTFFINYDILSCNYKNENTNCSYTRWPSARTWNFYPAIQNPVLAIYGLGDNTERTLTFSEKYQPICLSTTSTFDGLFKLNLIDEYSLSGRAGVGIIYFPGNHSSISVSCSPINESPTTYIWGKVLRPEFFNNSVLNDDNIDIYLYDDDSTENPINNTVNVNFVPVVLPSSVDLSQYNTATKLRVFIQNPELD